MGGEKNISTLESSQASPASPSGRNSMEMKMWMKTLGWQQYLFEIRTSGF